jgi:hypothetical protein
MDPQLVSWCQALERILVEHASQPYAYGEIETEVVVDRERSRYLLVDVGWNGLRRIHGPLVHVDVIDGKFWIQCDGTEDGVATQLVEAGVPRDRIVLASRHPTIRPYTDFAVA